MKSVSARRVERSGWWLGAGSVGLFACFVACGGVDEHRDPRKGGDAGESAEPEAGAPASTAGGSSAQGGASAGGDAGGAIGGAPERGEAGHAGDSGLGDEGGAAGQSAGGTGGEGGVGGVGGEGGEGGADSKEPVVDPVCGLGMAQVGAVSEWCGKVNVHLVGSTWVTDTDCTSGCRNDDVERLAYCKKFYPASATIVKVDQVASGTKDWKNAGCYDSYPDGPGISGEFACCALAP